MVDAWKREDEAKATAVAQKLEDARKTYKEAKVVFKQAKKAWIIQWQNGRENVRKLDQEAWTAQKEYEQAKAGQTPEDEALVARKLEDADALRKKYEEANDGFEKEIQLVF